MRCGCAGNASKVFSTRPFASRTTHGSPAIAWQSRHGTVKASLRSRVPAQSCMTGRLVIALADLVVANLDQVGPLAQWAGRSDLACLALLVKFVSLDGLCVRFVPLAPSLARNALAALVVLFVVRAIWAGALPYLIPTLVRYTHTHTHTRGFPKGFRKG